MNYVLIIEDEAVTAAPVKEALEMDGIRADIASNGNDGIRLFREKDIGESFHSVLGCF